MAEPLSGFAELDSIPVSVLIGAMVGAWLSPYITKHLPGADFHDAIAAGAILAVLLRKLVVAPLFAPITRLLKFREMFQTLADIDDPTLPISAGHRDLLRYSAVKAALIPKRAKAKS
jgi:hypothetical protein